ncbi:MAG: hypothetical protein WB439_14825 [Acidobacteriaceae bacterium]
MRLSATLLILLAATAARAQQLTAADIMSRVAANQDRSNAERTHYIYVQHAHSLSRKGHTIRCEEITDFRIIPTEKGSTQKLLTLGGHLLYKGKDLHYTQLDAHTTNVKDDDSLHIGVIGKDDDPMDLDLVENIRHNLVSDQSKDGIGAGLFPLTSKIQADYIYTLAGRAPMDGRDCYHITFRPRDKDDYGWKGDAFIDTHAFQPVLVHTTMARKIPFAVRTLLGTSLPGLGFTVTYAPEPADTPNALWFPVSFGTEFKLHVLFFFNRTIVLDVRNRDFQRTQVHSTILDATGNPLPPPPPPAAPPPH